MKHHLVLLITTLTWAASCGTSNTNEVRTTSNDTSFTVNGSIIGLDSGYVYFQNYQSPEKGLDSVTVHNGQFSYTGRADSPTFYLLGIMNFGQMEYRTGFFAENTNITITGRKDHSDGLKTTGGPVQEEFNSYLGGQKTFEDQQRIMTKSHDSLFLLKNFKGADSVTSLLEVLGKKQKSWAKDFFKQHPNSVVSAFEIYQDYSYEPDSGELDTMYSQLSSVVRTSYFGKKIAEALNIAKKTSVGNLAPDITLPDIGGKLITLSSYKKGFVLVDFWASWCGPCRDENPNLVKAWKRFHPKGFDILGVSLDERKEMWLNAIKYDGLMWSQVSDLKGFKNSAALSYGIRAIPMNYLLDKEGRILAKDLQGEALEKILEEVMK